MRLDERNELWALSAHHGVISSTRESDCEKRLRLRRPPHVTELHKFEEEATSHPH